MNSDRNFDGFASALALLDTMDDASRKRLIADIQKKDPGLAEKLLKNLFQFEDILKIPQRDVQQLLANTSLAVWALAFRDTNEKVKAYIYANLPASQAAMLEQETASIGPQRRSDVDEAKSEILQTAKKLGLV